LQKSSVLKNVTSYYNRLHSPFIKIIEDLHSTGNIKAVLTPLLPISESLLFETHLYLIFPTAPVLQQENYEIAFRITRLTGEKPIYQARVPIDSFLFQEGENSILSFNKKQVKGD